MSEYQYLKRTPVKGDVVERQTPSLDCCRITAGKLYIVQGIALARVEVPSNIGGKYKGNQNNFKVIKTLPGESVKPGDKYIVITNSGNYGSEYYTPGMIFTAEKITYSQDGVLSKESPDGSHYLSDIRVLCKAEALVDNINTQSETTMPNDSNIEVKVNDENVCSQTALQKQKKLKVYAIYFDQAGAQTHSGTFKTEEEATQLLATKEFIGCYVTIYKQATTKQQKLVLETVW